MYFRKSQKKYTTNATELKKRSIVVTNSDEKDGESGQWPGALWQASMEATPPLKPSRTQSCLLLLLLAAGTAAAMENVAAAADPRLVYHPFSITPLLPT